MKVKEIGTSFIKLEYMYKGEQTGYPFLFDISEHYRIHPQTGFTCTIM